MIEVIVIMSAVGFVRWATINFTSLPCTVPYVRIMIHFINPHSVKAMLLLIDCKDLMLTNPSYLNSHVERGLKKENVSVLSTFSASL